MKIKNYINKNLLIKLAKLTALLFVITVISFSFLKKDTRNKLLNSNEPASKKLFYKVKNQKEILTDEYTYRISMSEPLNTQLVNLSTFEIKEFIDKIDKLIVDEVLTYKELNEFKDMREYYIKLITKRTVTSKK